MVKELIGVLFCSLLSSAPLKNAPTDFKGHLVTSLNSRGNYTLDSVDSIGLGTQLRIYHYDDLLIDEVSDSSFFGSSFTSLMLTNSVLYIHDAAFEGTSISKMYFTGSQEEYQNLNLTYFSNSNISYYAFDEGFMNYWNKNIRPNADSNICNISKETYIEVYGLYKNLDDSDLETVDATKDLSGATIKDSMKELVRVFGSTEDSNHQEEWNQTSAITFIIVIAVLGMTSITIFFLLKTKNIIN